MYDLNMLFYTKKSKKNKAGEAPVYLRITLNGQRSELSIRKSVKPNIWNSKGQIIKVKSEKIRLANNYIEEIENKLNRIYNIAVQENKIITAEHLNNMVSGKDKKTKMLIPVLEEYIKLIEREKGNKYSPKTVARYSHALSHRTTDPSQYDLAVIL